MNLNDTKFGKIVVELNNFTNLINPEAINQFDSMNDEQLENLSMSDSLTGKIASLYMDLIKMMREVSAPRESFEEEVMTKEVEEGLSQVFDSRE